MKISSLRPGVPVWTINKHRMGNTTIMTISVFEVKIISVAEDGNSFVYSVNGNPERTGYENTATGFRKSKPVTVTSRMGYKRLATREEINKLKESK